MNRPKLSTPEVPPSIKKYYQYALTILLVLVLANALAAGLRTVSDSDMGWHIATGRYIVEHHKIPSTDVLSYTAADKEWLYPPAGQILLYLIDRFTGSVGLSWFCALVCLGTIGYLLRKRTLAAIALALCAIEPIAFRTAPRPDLFNTVLLAIFLGEIWDFHLGLSKRFWLFPLLMMLWVNLHPGFILGLAVIAAYLLIEITDLLFLRRRTAALTRLKIISPWLAASIAITLINPWGYKLYSTSLTLSGLAPQQQNIYNTSSYIGEFLSVPISTHLFKQLIDFHHAENGYTWLLLFALLTLALALSKKQFGVAIIQATALYLSLQHARYIGLFCVTTAILGATFLDEAFRRINESSSSLSKKNPPRFRIPAVASLLLVCILGIVTLIHTADFITNRTHIVFQTQSEFGAGESSWFPEGAVNFIRNQKLSGNIFAEYALGGFVSWRLGPEYPDFIDGRFDHLAPEILVAQNKLLSESLDSADWQSAADNWKINLLLILESAPRAADRQNALAFCQSANWRPIYLDEKSIVLLRNTPTNHSLIDRFEINCQTHKFIHPPLSFTPPGSQARKQLYDFYLNSGGMLFALQRDAEAEAALLSAKNLYPYDPNSRLVLAQLYERNQNYDRAIAEYHESLSLNETDGPWYQLGRIYLDQQRLTDSEQAFERAASLSVTPFIPYLALAQNELLLNHPDAALAAYKNAEDHSPYRNGAENLAPTLYAQIAEGRAQAYRMTSHLPLAIEYAQKAVELDPATPQRWSLLADLLDANNQPESAEQARQKAAAFASAPTAP